MYDGRPATIVAQAPLGEIESQHGCNCMVNLTNTLAAFCWPTGCTPAVRVLCLLCPWFESGAAVIKQIEAATQRAQVSDRMRQQAQEEAGGAVKMRDALSKQLAAANAMMKELHTQVARLERDSSEAVSAGM